MRVTFGDVCFDAGTRQLWRGDREIRLTRKAFDLLALLIERRPNAVAKQEIHSRLWPDTFVSDVSLQSLVFEIREAIGDAARKPRYVRTVHGFGYAFSGPTRETSAPAPPGHRVRGWLIGELGRLPLFEGENVLGREGRTSSPSGHRPSRGVMPGSRWDARRDWRIWGARTARSSAIGR